MNPALLPLLAWVALSLTGCNAASEHAGSSAPPVDEHETIAAPVRTGYGSVDDFLQNARRAGVRFIAPATLERGAAGTVMLEVDPMVLEPSATAAPGVEVDSGVTRLSPRMKAELLVHGEGKATQIGPGIQAVSEREKTTWKWTVVANEPGTLHLDGVLTALVRIQGEDLERPVRTFTGTIVVPVGAWHERLFAWLDEHVQLWQFIAGTIAIPLFTYWFKRRSEKKEGKAGDEPGKSDDDEKPGKQKRKKKPH